MNTETLIVEQEGAIAIVRINRPGSLNSLSRRVFQDLISVFIEFRKQALPKVIILTGAGEKAFVAGSDISEMKDLSASEARCFAELAKEALDGIEGLDRPVLAAVNGFALGGGCELAMACDLRIASERAKFGQPEINLGIIPGSGGTQRLPRLIGPSKTMRMVLTGELVDAKTALAMGLVDWVVPPDQLMNESKRIATVLSEKSGSALRLAKRAIRHGLNTDLTTALNYEMECFAQCFASEDQKEGMKAFLEKRKPNFKSYPC
jgi:enoyl-CoA hydratase